VILSVSEIADDNSYQATTLSVTQKISRLSDQEARHKFGSRKILRQFLRKQ
jgi:hypothetical protein